MRPEQKVIISARQTGECIERLLEWVEQSRPMLKSQCQALNLELRHVANELMSVVEAVERRPTAGLITSWGTARSELIGTMVSGDTISGDEDETRPALSRDRLIAMIPRDADGGLSVSLRLLAAERTETPYRYPIRMSLLGQLDLVKIIASAYLLHVPKRRRQLATAEQIAEHLAKQTEAISSQTFTGIARRDVDDLRETLHAMVPDCSAINRLEAAGYWETLGSLAPHLPEALRRQTFSLLWGGDAQLTALFDTLSNGLEQLGFAGEAFAGLDAVLTRHKTSGWMIRHTESVIAGATIAACHGHPESRIRISSRHGRGVDIERFLLAALIDEVSLPVPTASLPLIETADMLIVPAPSAVLLWPVAHKPDTRISIPSVSGLSAAEAVEIFIAQKPTYLTERSIRRHGITSLVVATDIVERTGSRKIDGATNALIANWIERTQGDAPHIRERRRTGLSILAAETREMGAIEPVLPDTDGTDLHLTATIASVLDDNAEWVQEWTPNRPFRNVFKWSPSPPQPENPDALQRSAEILRFERSKIGEPLSAPVPPTMLAVSYDLANLQHAIAQATSSTIHVQQLASRVTELRRSVTDRFLRLHLANDPSATVEWRRQVCNVARNRLQRALQESTLGHLQLALMFKESEILAVLARLKSNDPRRGFQGLKDLRSLEPGRIVEACFEAWIVTMRRSIRTRDRARTFQIPGPVLGHIVDELVLGSVRIGLQEKLAEAVRRIQMSAQRAADCERSIAALLERGICAYVETLDPTSRSMRSGAHRDTRFGMESFVVQPARNEAMQVDYRGTRRVGKVVAPEISEEWAETLAYLIEANILGAGMLGGTSRLNRELGEILNALTANQFEGAQ